MSGLFVQGDYVLIYRPGLYTCLAAAGVTIISVCITTVYMARKNVLQKQGRVVIEETEGFRYTL